MIEAAEGRLAPFMAISETPDVILLDVSMPVVDGFEVLRRLRQHPTTKDTPVIMLPSLMASKGELTAMRLGVKHYISKPWEPGLLETAVRVALHEREDC